MAVWPPSRVLDLVRDLARPVDSDIRWATPDQWHVTLLFLGDVDDRLVEDISTRLGGLAGSGEVAVALGPETAWFPGKRVLQIPVGGLEELHERVRRVLSNVPELSASLDDGGRPFSGHLTLARTRGQRRPSRALADSISGVAIETSWMATTLSLVSSTLRSDGARYEVLRTIELDSSVEPNSSVKPD